MTLSEAVEKIPLVDVHTHIDFRKPAADSPVQIMLYHYIATELRSLGIPVEEVRAKADDPVAKLLPHFKQIRNTATYWCLRRILEDLYEFPEHPTPENWGRLKEAILGRAEDRSWPTKVLKEKINVDRIFLTINPLVEAKPEFDRTLYVASLRLDPLVRGLSKSSIEELEKASGGEASSLEGFRECLAERFKAFREAAVTAAISFDAVETYKPTHKALAEEAYWKLYTGRPLPASEIEALRSSALTVILDLCREFKLPVQMMVGVVRDLPGASPPDLAVSFKQEGLLELCRFLYEYGDVDFHFISAYRFQSHELTVIAKNYPNVYLTGYWWYCFFPESIVQHLLERIQLLPAGKICGFFSDAYVVEWIYGKAALARKMTVEALQSMVEKGFYTEDLAEEVARLLIQENPRRLFRL